jgi:hypothetical protein
MLIAYEKIEDYIKKMKLMSKTDTTFYVSIQKNVGETGLVTPVIMVQALERDNCFMIRYTEELPSFQLIQTFMNIQDPTLRSQAEKNYNDSYQVFEKKVDETYNKILDIIKGYGFINIERAMIQ